MDKSKLDGKKFGAWLAVELDKRGWDIAQLARATDISRPYLTQYINGEVESTAETSAWRFFSIAEALNLDEKEVFKAAGFPVFERAIDGLRIPSSLSESSLDALTRVLDALELFDVVSSSSALIQKVQIEQGRDGIKKT